MTAGFISFCVNNISFKVESPRSFAVLIVIFIVIAYLGSEFVWTHSKLTIKKISSVEQKEVLMAFSSRSVKKAKSILTDDCLKTLVTNGISKPAALDSLITYTQENDLNHVNLLLKEIKPHIEKIKKVVIFNSTDTLEEYKEIVSILNKAFPSIEFINSKHQYATEFKTEILENEIKNHNKESIVIALTGGTKITTVMAFAAVAHEPEIIMQAIEQGNGSVLQYEFITGKSNIS